MHAFAGAAILGTVFELDGRMLDAEAILQDRVDLPHHFSLIQPGRQDGVEGQDLALISQRPGMDIVHVGHSGKVANRGTDACRIDPVGRSLQQDMRRLADDRPRAT